MSTTINDNQPTDSRQTPKPASPPSFAETAMRLGGKSEDEVRRMGAVDAADEQVEQLFDKKYQTVSSPIHRAVWEATLPVDQFGFDHPPLPSSETAAVVMDRSIEIVRQHRDAGTLLSDERKIREEVMQELAQAGYWGLLVDTKYGGYGVPFTQFAQFLTRMATVDPTIAGLASVHACIGAVDPVQTFGTEDQKQRFLPRLASGEALSAFALTEPNAGSDLTALRTTAILEDDHYRLYGEKLFITNVRPGRTVGVVCLIDNSPAVLIVDLPETETAEFQLKKYGLYALKNAYNQGITFNGLKVPRENLLDPGHGDGLTIAYHGLNRGRVALCANAAGTMRMMLADMLPWARFRVTYGEEIVKRELVRRRVAHLAGLIVACDALTEWCGSLLDLGYRGEMECIVAKIFGSEALKEAAIEIAMKTHGGRSFLHGHWFGDNIHDLLAPCIYEGEGEMLGMAFFKSLVKEHGRHFFEPIGQTLHDKGIKHPNMANPAHAWALKGPLMHYAGWWFSEQTRLLLHSSANTDAFEQASRQGNATPGTINALRKQFTFATRFLRRSRLEISAVMRKHQLKLPDRQCRMAELSGRIQNAVVMLCTSLYGARHADPLVGSAAWSICSHLQRQLCGTRASDRDLRHLVKLGESIADGECQLIEGIEPGKILMPYNK